MDRHVINLDPEYEDDMGEVLYFVIGTPPDAAVPDVLNRVAKLRSQGRIRPVMQRKIKKLLENQKECRLAEEEYFRMWILPNEASGFITEIEEGRFRFYCYKRIL